MHSVWQHYHIKETKNCKDMSFPYTCSNKLGVLSLFQSSFGPWTKSQAGLVSCLEPWSSEFVCGGIEITPLIFCAERFVQTSMNKMAILAAAVCCSTQTASVSRMHDEDVWPWRIPPQHFPTVYKRTHSSSSCQGRAEAPTLPYCPKGHIAEVPAREELRLQVEVVESCRWRWWKVAGGGGRNVAGGGPRVGKDALFLHTAAQGPRKERPAFSRLTS